MENKTCSSLSAYSWSSLFKSIFERCENMAVGTVISCQAGSLWLYRQSRHMWPKVSQVSLCCCSLLKNESTWVHPEKLKFEGKKKRKKEKRKQQNRANFCCINIHRMAIQNLQIDSLKFFKYFFMCTHFFMFWGWLATLLRVGVPFKSQY